MKASEILHAAGDLLEPPGAWTRYHWACDANGEPVDSRSSEAVSWCAIGAIRKINGAFDSNSLYFLRRAVFAYTSYNFSISGWNDRACTQQEVVTAFRKAEQLAKDAGE